MLGRCFFSRADLWNARPGVSGLDWDSQTSLPFHPGLIRGYPSSTREQYRDSHRPKSTDAGIPFVAVDGWQMPSPLPGSRPIIWKDIYFPLEYVCFPVLFSGVAIQPPIETIPRPSLKRQKHECTMNCINNMSPSPASWLT